MNENELKTGTKQFALRVMRLVRALLRTAEGQVEPLRQEAHEITAILTTSRKTASSRLRAADQKSKIKDPKS